MKIKLLTIGLYLLAVTLYGDEAEAMIAKARAHVGSEEKLKSIQTLQYFGVISNDKGEQEGQLTLKFKRPNKQVIELVTDDQIDVTAINGHEGYILRTDRETQQKQLAILTSEKVNRLIINAYENLNFFDATEKRNGTVEYKGESDELGNPAIKLRFSYPRGIFYDRFFDESTGDLLATRSDKGIVMVEKEDIISEGMRFPKIVEAYKQGELQHTIIFERVVVNEPIDDDLFEVPSL